MKSITTTSTFCLFLIFASCNDKVKEPTTHSEHSHDDHDHDEEMVVGPHGGTLLSENDFSIELKIFESGTTPRLKIYAYNKSEAISPTEYKINIDLTRLGRAKEKLTLTPTKEFYLSNDEVAEPHSFTVEVTAIHQDANYHWHYDTFEGRTTIPDEVAKLSGIVTEKASKREIGNLIKIRGNILPNEHKIAHVVPRFSGVVKEGSKHIGDVVKKGEVLALIESNQSLQPFEVKSQISGTIINGHVIPGEFVPENQWIYIVADISEVWGDFYVPTSQISAVKNDQKIKIATIDGNQTTEGVISYVAPYVDENSQSQLVRVNIENSKGEFLPGMFVIGKISTIVSNKNLVIKKSAIQNYNNQKSAFIKFGEVYEVRPLEVGMFNDDWIEVLAGLNEGDEYVSENSFLIKADILKAGASHDH